jgi:putative flippase GtrA
VAIGFQPNPAAEIAASGPLGAANVQAALDLIAAAGTFYTAEQFASYTLGTGSSYATLKTFTIASGTTRKLNAYVLFTGGTAAAPTSGYASLIATARRTAGGATSVSSPAPTITGNITALAVNWAVSGGSVVLQFRASGGPTVRATLLYSWLEQLPP